MMRMQDTNQAHILDRCPVCSVHGVLALLVSSNLEMLAALHEHNPT